MAVRYWIGVVSRDHVMTGVAGGFAQVGHGKSAPLRRMSAGDWLIYYSPKITYGLYEVTKAPDGNWAATGEKYVLADKLAADTFAKAKVEAFARIGDVDPAHITSTVHPLRGLGGGYQYEVPLLPGDHVTDDTGTGFVHTAPGHGMDDFELWMSSTRDLVSRGIDPAIPFTVDDAGFYTTDAPGFDGARVIDDAGKKGDANNRVIAALAERGMMLARGRLKHQYPHSWRSKKPIIFRNTPQWFVYMDRDIEGKAGDTLRHRALAAIDATRFVPQAGQNRLRSMIADRPDWVLSRQRAWGVPIAVFVNKETGELLNSEVVNHRIGQAFEAEGADAWFTPGAKARFLGDAVPDHPVSSGARAVESRRLPKGSGIVQGHTEQIPQFRLCGRRPLLAGVFALPNWRNCGNAGGAGSARGTARQIHIGAFAKRSQRTGGSDCRGVVDTRSGQRSDGQACACCRRQCL